MNGRRADRSGRSIRPVGNGVAVVLGDGVNAYEAVRSLTSCNIPTILLSSTRPRDGGYCGCEIRRCPPVDDPAKLVAYMNRSLDAKKLTVPIACSDEHALFLAQYRDQLDKRFRYLAPSPDLVDRLVDKREFFKLCRELDLPVPQTFIAQNSEELRSALDRLEFPCIVKTVQSSKWSESLGHTTQSVGDPMAASRLCERAWGLGMQMILQEEIPGGPETISFIGGLYDEAGRPERVFVGQKLGQFPLEVGSTSHAQLRMDSSVLELANSFARKTGIRGLVDIEVKQDPRNGQFYFIEVNARNGQWHRISQSGGMNICAYYVLRQLGETEYTSGFEPHKEGRRWVYPQAHLCSCVDRLGLRQGVTRWWRDFRLADVACAWDPIDLRRMLRTIRVIVGHLRE